MAAQTRSAGRGQRGPVQRALAPARQLWGRFRRQILPAQTFVLASLIVLSVLYAQLSITVSRWVPASSIIVVLLLGGFFLRLRGLMLLFATVTACVTYSTVSRLGLTPVPIGTLVIIGITAVFVLAYARSREKLGVQGTLGESMLVDLRDRLRAQGLIPQLPKEWKVESVLRSAYGDSFSGDFLVATRSTDGRWLEMVLVDVSGKGQAAGTRALLLSGSFGGLLGALPREQFLPAANQYLLRQDWAEGFATAVHVAIDLGTGEYRLASAGHPPAAHFHAGSGRWELLDSINGPLLGVVDEAWFPACSGRLDRGDALMVYTDGLVETPGKDLALGIDRLMGEAERLVRRGEFTGGAARIVDGTRAPETDDRALVLVTRS